MTDQQQKQSKIIAVKLPNVRRCAICNKEYKNFGVHLKSHNISPKEYYDKYLKKNENEGICPVCGKETTFISLGEGYRYHC